MGDGRAIVDLSIVEWFGRIVLHPGHPSEAGPAGSAESFDWPRPLAVVLLVASIGGLRYWYNGRRGDDP